MKTYVVYLSVIHVIKAEDDYEAGEKADRLTGAIDDFLIGTHTESGSTELTRVQEEDDDGSNPSDGFDSDGDEPDPEPSPVGGVEVSNA